MKKLTLAEQLKALGYQESEETKKYNENKKKKEQQQNNKMKKEMKRKAYLDNLYEEREQRKKELNAQPKDKVFNIMALQDMDQVYEITAWIDAISRDHIKADITIVSLNCLCITINGKQYVADHTHVRSDQVKIDPNWKIGDKITFTAKLDRYEYSIKKKYNLTNIEK